MNLTRIIILNLLTNLGRLTQVEPFLSPYIAEWDETVPVCSNGPVKCGNRSPCGERLACKDDIFCTRPSKYMCKEECEEGYSLDPFAFCSCIADTKRNAMFCAKDVSELTFLEKLLNEDPSDDPLNSKEVT